MSCENIDCNQGRNSTCAPTARRQRTCDELGVCQGRTPACRGDCQAALTRVDTDQLPPGGFWISPGVANFEPAPEPLTWLEISLIAIAASGAIGLAAGVATMWFRGML